MKKIISKFNIIILCILIISCMGNFVFAATLVDQKKAYDICMKYHPPRIQGLCSQIGPSTTFEEILGEHTRHGSSEVEAEKDNMLATSTTDQNTNNTTSDQNTNNTTSDQNTNNTTSDQNNVNTSKPKPTSKEAQILGFAYSSWFWTIINIIGVLFFIITYIVDRIKYFKRKNKQRKK